MTKLLSTELMAEFANSGCLFFEGLIDEDINKEFLNDIGHTDIDDVDNIQHYFQNIKSSSSILSCAACVSMIRSPLVFWASI